MNQEYHKDLYKSKLLNEVLIFILKMEAKETTMDEPMMEFRRNTMKGRYHNVRSINIKIY